MNRIEKIIDIIANTEVFVEHTLTQAEIAEREQYVNEQAEREAEQAAKDAARQAVLDKLGLSADEVAALLN